MRTACAGTGMLGTGPRTAIIRQRFELACRRAGILAGRRPVTLDCSRFRAPTPAASTPQMRLF